MWTLEITPCTTSSWCRTVSSSVTRLDASPQASLSTLSIAWAAPTPVSAEVVRHVREVAHAVDLVAQDRDDAER